MDRFHFRNQNHNTNILLNWHHKTFTARYDFPSKIEKQYLQHLHLETSIKRTTVDLIHTGVYRHRESTSGATNKSKN